MSSCGCYHSFAFAGKALGVLLVTSMVFLLTQDEFVKVLPDGSAVARVGIIRETETSANTINPNSQLLDDAKTLPPAGNNSVSFVASIWAQEEEEEVKPHRLEVEAAIAANLCNKYFYQVVIILDSASETANCVRFSKRIMGLRDEILFLQRDGPPSNLPILTCIDRSYGQPTYLEMFQYSLSSHVLGDVVVMSNTDHAFDESVKNAADIPSNSVWVVATAGFDKSAMPPLIRTAYEVHGPNGDDVTHDFQATSCRPRVKSWDAYVFRKDTFIMENGESRLITSNNNFARLRKSDIQPIHYFMNMNWMEFAALADLIVGLDNPIVFNACEFLQAWHFHLTKKMHKEGTGAVERNPSVDGSSVKRRSKSGIYDPPSTNPRGKLRIYGRGT